MSCEDDPDKLSELLLSLKLWNSSLEESLEVELDIDRAIY